MYARSHHSSALNPLKVSHDLNTIIGAHVTFLTTLLFPHEVLQPRGPHYWSWNLAGTLPFQGLCNCNALCQEVSFSRQTACSLTFWGPYPGHLLGKAFPGVSKFKPHPMFLLIPLSCFIFSFYHVFNWPHVYTHKFFFLFPTGSKPREARDFVLFTAVSSIPRMVPYTQQFLNKYLLNDWIHWNFCSFWFHSYFILDVPLTNSLPQHVSFYSFRKTRGLPSVSNWLTFLPWACSLHHWLDANPSCWPSTFFASCCCSTLFPGASSIKTGFGCRVSPAVSTSSLMLPKPNLFVRAILINVGKWAKMIHFQHVCYVKTLKKFP